MSDSVRPHRRQPTRLPRPWDSPGKNAGVGCHCLLQCNLSVHKSVTALQWSVEYCVKSLQAQTFLCNPMDCSPPGCSVRGILQARIPEWVAISSSRGLFPTQGSNLQLYSLLLLTTNPWEARAEYYSALKREGTGDAVCAACKP